LLNIEKQVVNKRQKNNYNNMYTEDVSKYVYSYYIDEICD